MSEPDKRIRVTPEEQLIIIESLNDKRKDLIEEDKDPTPVNKVMLKAIDAPDVGLFGFTKHKKKKQKLLEAGEER